MAIYVITHKYISNPPKLSMGYKWLYVGAYSQPGRNENYDYDDVGRQISEKNKNFCELTGLYWIRHNCDDPIKGVSHYRRFFTHNRFSGRDKNFYSYEEINELLQEFDCIVSERLYFPYGNIENHYRKSHYVKDLELLEQVVKEVAPDYIDAYKKALSNNYLFPYNMIIANSNVFDKYCDWLFQILLELETREDLTGYSTYQSRIYGFLSERLLNVWLIKNEINYKEIPTVQTDGRIRYRIRLYLEKIFKRPLHFLAQIDALGDK